MSKLSHAQQHAVLSQYSWTSSGTIRVRATHGSETLLKAAGIHDPKALEFYIVPVKRDERGFLILDEITARERKPIADADDSVLFEKGGLFGGGTAESLAAVFDRIGHMNDSDRSEIEPELAGLCEIPLTRTFEVQIGEHSRVRFQVIGFDDRSPNKPSDQQILAAIDALRASRQLTDYEQL